MTIALGIWDLFALGIPGSLQLALFGYIAIRLHWVDGVALLQAPSGLLFAGMAVASYVLGHLFYAPATMFDRLTHARLHFHLERVRREFVERNPAARGSPILRADVYLLHAAVELRAREVAGEIGRLLASALMMRNCSVPLLLATFTALAELFVGRYQVPGAVATLCFAAATFAAVMRGVRIRAWALSKALELAFWLPDVDQQLRLQTASAIPKSYENADDAVVAVDASAVVQP